MGRGSYNGKTALKRLTPPILALCLAVVPCAKIYAQAKEKPAAPPLAPFAYLLEKLGPQALAVLEDNGYIIAAGNKRSGRRLVHVQWNALQTLFSGRAGLTALLRVYANAPDFDASEEDLKNLYRLQDLPTGGLLSPPVHAAADLLAAHIHERAALPAGAEDNARHSAFYGQCGSHFLRKNHAELIEDFRPLAREYAISCMGTDAGDAHYRIYMTDIRKVSSLHEIRHRKMLREDFKTWEPSNELVEHIHIYLLDQRRLWNISQTEKRLKRITRGSTLEQDLHNLRQILPAVENTRTFFKDLRQAIEQSEKGARIRFRGTDLHVHTSDGGSRQDRGDTIDISMAYWIEGLDTGEKADLYTVGFVDDMERGIRSRFEQSLKPSHGGPYTFKTRIKFDSDTPLTYRLYLNAPGAETLKKEITIGVAPGFKGISSALGEAENLISQCRLNEAGKSLEAAAEEASALSDKIQFRAILSDIHARVKELAYLKKIRSQLKESLDSVALHASSEHCSYKTENADYALNLLKKLPPGCDQIRTRSGHPLSVLLGRQYHLTRSRALLQKAFDEGVADAERLAKGCRIQEASDLYASSLALLDSDTGAKCGAWALQYTRVRIGSLHHTGQAATLGEAIDRKISAAEKAFAQEKYTRAARITYPLILGIDTLKNASCYSSKKERAEKIAHSAGLAIAPLSQKELVLPKDSIGKHFQAVLEASKQLRQERLALQELENNIEQPNAAASAEDLP